MENVREGVTVIPAGRQPGTVPETPDIYGCYPRLSDIQMATLSPLGGRRPTAPGEILFREGDQSCDFFVVSAGKVAVVEGYGTPAEQVIGVHGPGRFLGELSLLSGEALLVTAVTVDPGEVLQIPASGLRGLITHDPAVGDLILQAYLSRRSLLIGLGAGLKIIGSGFSPRARRLRDFTTRNRLPYRWIDLEADERAEQLLRRLDVPAEETPIVILYGRDILRNPSNAELAAALGLSAPAAGREVCDLVVVGAGPAGLAAAVYAASDGLATVVVDALATGGQAGTSSRIENYLGFPSGISGAELAERAAIQARKFGANIHIPAEAVSLARRGDYHEVGLDHGLTLCGRMVVLASGVRYRKLQVVSEDRVQSTSVYYAASQAEAQLCRSDPVGVLGGGNSAAQASLFLAHHASVVRLIINGDDLGANMSRYLADQIQHSDRIDVIMNSEVCELAGRDTLEAVVVMDVRTGARRAFPARALFVFIGADPHTGWLRDKIALDERGFVRTGNATDAGNGAGAAKRPMPLETSQSGVFAAGDVRSGSIKRVASAVGEGAMAMAMVHERRTS
jgi:thioredoxin reductase (NADPH)